MLAVSLIILIGVCNGRASGPEFINSVLDQIIHRFTSNPNHIIPLKSLLQAARK